MDTATDAFAGSLTATRDLERLHSVKAILEKRKAHHQKQRVRS